MRQRAGWQTREQLALAVLFGAVRASLMRTQQQRQADSASLCRVAGITNNHCLLRTRIFASLFQRGALAGFILLALFLQLLGDAAALHLVRRAHVRLKVQRHVAFRMGTPASVISLCSPMSSAFSHTSVLCFCLMRSIQYFDGCPQLSAMILNSCRWSLRVCLASLSRSVDLVMPNPPPTLTSWIMACAPGATNWRSPHEKSTAAALLAWLMMTVQMGTLHVLNMLTMAMADSSSRPGC